MKNVALNTSTEFSDSAESAALSMTYHIISYTLYLVSQCSALCSLPMCHMLHYRSLSQTLRSVILWSDTLPQYSYSVVWLDFPPRYCSSELQLDTLA